VTRLREFEFQYANNIGGGETYIKYSGETAARRKRLNHDLVHHLKELISGSGLTRDRTEAYIINNVTILFEIDWVDDYRHESTHVSCGVNGGM
jgi:hypothetical protein